MAIVIEAITVVVVTSALERRFPGGTAAFAQQAPNSTFRSDGKLAALSFMVFADAKLFVCSALGKHGFGDPWSTRAEDIAVVDQSGGFLGPCDWLKVDLRRLTDPDGKPFDATIAWIDDEEPVAFAAPYGWHPRRMEQVAPEDLERNYEVVKVDREDETGGVVITYRHLETGRTLSIGHPGPPGFREWREEYRALGQELGALMQMPDSPERALQAAQLYDRASRLVGRTGAEQPGPFLRQGIAARLAGQWSKAEPAFRKVTELSPDDLNGWLELTWTLSSLRRLDDAETAARQATKIDSGSAAAHGNLASTLLQQGRLEEAMAAIERAIELDPSDATNLSIRAQVRAALPQPQTTLPWYKRWFR